MGRIDVVKIMSSQLKKMKTVRVYVPTYDSHLEERFSVLYMHDGHNLFSKETSAFGLDWNAKEILETSELLFPKKLIVVGIDEPSIERYEEYSPFEASCFVKTIPSLSNHVFEIKGHLYLEWIVKTLKPWIDTNYPTKKNETYMAGSSMGGYFSLYAGYRYPHIFSKIGVLSPALWYNESKMMTFLDKHFNQETRLFLTVGTEETSSDSCDQFPNIYLNNARLIKTLAESKSIKSFEYHEVLGGTHDEAAWKRLFPRLIEWLLSAN